MNDFSGPPDEGRRSFFQWVIRLCGGVIGLLTVVPGIGYLLSPILAGTRGQRRRVIFQNPTDAGSPTFVAARFEGQEETAPGIFVRTVGGKPQVLSARCTHAGCAVTWKSDSGEFFCPCHNGHFDENGNVKSGPPPRPLDHLNAETMNGQLYIEEKEA